MSETNKGLFKSVTGALSSKRVFGAIGCGFSFLALGYGAVTGDSEVSELGKQVFVVSAALIGSTGLEYAFPAINHFIEKMAEKSKQENKDG